MLRGHELVQPTLVREPEEHVALDGIRLRASSRQRLRVLVHDLAVVRGLEQRLVVLPVGVDERLRLDRVPGDREQLERGRRRGVAMADHAERAGGDEVVGAGEAVAGRVAVRGDACRLVRLPRVVDLVRADDVGDLDERREGGRGAPHLPSP